MIEIIEYDIRWKDSFSILHKEIQSAAGQFIQTIEHVGSTSVEGLAAKPVIDIDIVINSYEHFPELCQSLAKIGYVYRGDLGIQHRHAFINASHQIKHHLYACLNGSIALKNHLAIRDNLRKDAKLRDQYSELKKRLAISSGSNDEYCQNKTDFLISVLKNSFSQEELDVIKDENFNNTQKSETPPLETSRLALKAISPKDIPSCQRYFNNYNIIKHLVKTVPWPYPDNGVKEYFESVVFPQQGNNHWYWGVFLKSNPEECIGVVDLWRKGSPENRGFWLAEQHWGHGYMTEAVSIVMDHAFDKLGFEYLVFANGFGNEKSRRVKEKTGARLLSIQKTEIPCHDYDKSEFWFLTKDRWKNR